MKKIFRKYPEILMTVIALIFVGMLITSFTLGINDIVSRLHGATTAPTAGNSIQFNLSAAAQLNLYGMSTSTPSTGAPAATSPSGNTIALPTPSPTPSSPSTIVTSTPTSTTVSTATSSTKVVTSTTSTSTK